VIECPDIPENTVKQEYTTMLRGNERKDIFIDEEDKGKFIKIVFDKKADGAF